MAPINRRDWLKAAGLTALGAGLGSRCAAPQPQGRRLSRVRVSPDRVIRTTVGLRPTRASGFLVRVERFDDRTVVHNYGHGGNGMTLSWGTAHLAVEHVLASGERSCGILGCGAVGLATARLLQRHGIDVTIYAKAIPPDTTSNMSAAWFSPGSPGRNRSPTYVTQHARAARFAHAHYQDLLGDDYGVKWIERYTASDEPPEEAATPNPLADLTPGRTALTPDQHPFPRPYVQRAWTMVIEPSTYLAAMLRDVRLAGAAIVVGELAALDAVLRLPERLIVNCTGLGARDLFGDDELSPTKGQLTVLMPQPEVDYVTQAGDLYMVPRRNGIALGGTREQGEWSLEPNVAARERILEGHARFFAEMS